MAYPEKKDETLTLYTRDMLEDSGLFGIEFSQRFDESVIPENDPMFEQLTYFQRKAVVWPGTSSVQILAGPGSGKTRTLTSRVAWLVRQGMDPKTIIVVTFTHKAAEEMRQRLTDMIGYEQTNKLLLGTFHSVALKFLKRHSRILRERKRIVHGGFSIIDTSDQTTFIKEAIAKALTKAEQVEANRAESVKAQVETIRKIISNWKAIRKSPSQALREAHQAHEMNGRYVKIRDARFYQVYETLKLRANVVDYDDLILYAVELLEVAPSVVEHIQHVLVDEFQDTSGLQYDLIRLFAQEKKAITTVGDPDQSIYGWRHAKKRNLRLMQKDYGLRPPRSMIPKPKAKAKKEQVNEEADEEVAWETGAAVQAKGKGKANDQAEASESEDDYGDENEYDEEGHGVLSLMENFRSSENILKAAQRVIEQDPKRLQKKLVPFHPSGEKVSLINVGNAYQEADLIVEEIERLRAYSGGMLTYSDHAVLVRYHAMSRALESAFSKAKIPYKIVGGMAFWERLEIKDIGAYLILAENPSHSVAFKRVVNVPARGIGDATLQKIVTSAQELNMETMEYAEAVCSGQIDGVDLGNAGRSRALVEFVNIIQTLRSRIAQGMTLSSTIKWLLQRINYIEAHLKKQKNQDLDERKLALVELLSYAADVDGIQRDRTTFREDDPVKVSLDDILTYKRKDDFKIDMTAPESQSQSQSQPQAASQSADGAMPSSQSQRQLLPAKNFNSEYARKDALEADGGKLNPLRQLMAGSALGGVEKEKGEVKDAVTIVTSHASKGSEWPVVFVAGVEDEKYPAFFASSYDLALEEIRTLFVAMTRAKAFLYLTTASERHFGTFIKHCKASPFIIGGPSKVIPGDKNGKKKKFESILDEFVQQIPNATPEVMSTVGKVIGRKLPPSTDIDEAVAEFTKKCNERAAKDHPHRDRPYETSPVFAYTEDSSESSESDSQSQSWNSQRYKAPSTQGTGRPFGSFGTQPQRTGTFGNFSNRAASSTQPFSGFSSVSSMLNNGKMDMAKGLASLTQVPSSINAGAPTAARRGRALGMRPMAASQGTARPYQPPSMLGGEIDVSHHRAAKAEPAPSFTNEVRLQARPEDLGSIVRPDGTAPRPNADLASFQGANRSATDLLRLLPGEDQQAASSTPATTTKATRGRKRKAESTRQSDSAPAPIRSRALPWSQSTSTSKPKSKSRKR